MHPPFIMHPPLYYAPRSLPYYRLLHRIFMFFYLSLCLDVPEPSRKRRKVEQDVQGSHNKAPAGNPVDSKVSTTNLPQVFALTLLPRLHFFNVHALAGAEIQPLMRQPISSEESVLSSRYPNPCEGRNKRSRQSDCFTQHWIISLFMSQAGRRIKIILFHTFQKRTCEIQ